MSFNDHTNGRESRKVDPEISRGRGWSTRDTPKPGADHRRTPTSAHANLVGALSDEDDGDEGMKRKKKILFNGNANAESWRRRGRHFRSRRRGRQRLVDGVVRREEEKRNSNGPDAGDVTVQHVDDENRKAEKAFHRPGWKI